MDLSPGDIGKALGRVPSGCAILTAASGDGRMGMLASWIQQAGFDPPAVSVAVRKGRPIEPIIDAAGRFVLNLVGEGEAGVAAATGATSAAMFRHFGKGFAPGEDAFAGLATRDIEGGVALSGALAVLSCRVAGKHDAGDHWLYVGHVSAAAAREGVRPYVHLRKSGLNY